ncbi:3-isopropylmalate dehydrogenase [Burkholderia aenigmatica]|uniref:3-isopropylmalate dehydrogenase n=1 Tax=Burkholderia aenigmatica TaxID=2015348 RepID=A0ABY6XTV3_9BURK|nr:isocitrate/isopropylmalate family dehydrogenase [Burkholderia aenigmatica]VWC73489.1 3-isopropylmalate dehydrogenase [Burkholderia aenigmatica]
MHILIIPGSIHAAPLVSHVIALLDDLKSRNSMLDYTCVDAGTPSDGAYKTCFGADIVLATPGARHATGVAEFAKVAGLHTELHAISIPAELKRFSPVSTRHARATDCLILGDASRSTKNTHTGGVVAGEHELVGWHTQRYTEGDIRRLAHRAFGLARTRSCRLTSVDRSDRMDVMGMWRDIVSETAVLYPDIRLEHLLVEQAIERFVVEPDGFDTVLAGGDLAPLLAAQASALTGFPGLLTRARMGDGPTALYEIGLPVHMELPACLEVDLDACAAANAVSLLLRHPPQDSMPNRPACPPQIPGAIPSLRH